MAASMVCYSADKTGVHLAAWMGAAMAAYSDAGWADHWVLKWAECSV